jgi:alanyl-tRNA synthetase
MQGHDSTHDPGATPNMDSNLIRQAFIEFFREREHVQLPSSSLVPVGDPTVLLTIAGMQQMMPYFLGLEQPPAPRLTSIQKCFRTVDIDEVGDESHLTFFEMLGNFSVGDYFKPEAIDWAWELLTERFGLPVERLWVTVHLDDDFSYRYWQDEIGVPESKIRKLGDKDNWWGPVGETGPNGPDSEIFYDLGAHLGCGRDDCGPGCECGRFLEIWNLVFMEFYKETDGSQRPLPKKNIDTGMGLERISMILQGGSTVFETDLYAPIIEHAAGLADVTYGRDESVDRSLRVIGDHARAVTFLIADGVFPGNEGRSYVLRRVLRRAVRHGRLLGLNGPFLGDIAATVASLSREHHPDVERQLSRIQQVIFHEEAQFSRTLETGMARFESLVTSRSRDGGTEIPGEEAFRLYDTYGFPLELTEELARDLGLSVAREGFDRAMERQRQQSRAGADQLKSGDQLPTDLLQRLAEKPTKFFGYSHTELSSTVAGLLTSDASADTAEAGTPAAVILRATPFYAESGGQVGDTGEIATPTGVFQVEDTRRPHPDVIVHLGTVREGFIQAGQEAEARVDAERRARIRRNHTATHLLHAALRQTLGDHVRQAGSLVAPNRLRFDFTSLEAVADDAVRQIQAAVNEQVIRNTPVTTSVKPYQEAVAEGAIALFGEKYGDTVRVVAIDGYSKELCGGTHVERTGEVGPFIITQESSIASGVRRIEALTGEEAIGHLTRVLATAEDLGRQLHTSVDELPGQVATLTARLREYEREIERLRLELTASSLDTMLEERTIVDGVSIVASSIGAPNRDVMLQTADRIRDRLRSGVIVLGSTIDERPALLAMVTRDLVDRGLHAGRLVGDVAQVLGGRGGGRPDVAQGGGTDPSRLNDAIAMVPDLIQEQLRSTNS